MSFYFKVNDIKLYYEFILLFKYLIKKYLDGFYIYGFDIDDYVEDGKVMSVKVVVEYIVWYVFYLVIVEFRIIDIDYDKYEIIWIYDLYEDDKKFKGEKLGW